MKEFGNYILSRVPKIYANILRLKGNFNLEKILFLNLVKDGDIVFDIGANQGYYTILFSHLVGKQGEVHAFEPVLPTFEELSKEIFKHKRYNNVYLNNTAVSDTEGTMNMYMPANDHRQSSLKTHNAGSWLNAKNIEKYEVKVIKIDEYVQSMQKKRLNFIKLDVEGAELLALKGGKEAISKYLPIIYLEVCLDWTKNFDYKPIDLVEFLTSLGYSNFYLLANKFERLTDITESVWKNDFYSANLLCTRNDHHIRINHLINGK